MKELTRTVFEAEDGSIHATRADCEAREAVLRERAQRTTYWRVTHNPDLTEGRGHYGCDFLEVFGPQRWNAQDLVTDFCFQRFGRKTAFVQGVSPITSWSISKLEEEDFHRLDPSGRVGDFTHPGKKLYLELQGKDLVEKEKSLG
jgi:hypothetical protein